MSSEYYVQLFQLTPEVNNVKGNLKLIRVKKVNKAMIAVDNQGKIETFLGGNTQGVNTNPFVTVEKSSYAKQVRMRIEGKIHSIDVHAILKYAFPDTYLDMPVYQKQLLNTEKMYQRIRENKALGWRIQS